MTTPDLFSGGEAMAQIAKQDRSSYGLRFGLALAGAGLAATTALGMPQSAEPAAAGHIHEQAVVHLDALSQEEEQQRPFFDGDQVHECFQNIPDCLRLGSAAVALVTFETDNDDARAITADTEEMVAWATGGILTADVDVVPATPAAHTKLEQLTEDGCVIDGIVSVAVDAVMADKLQPYDAVLSAVDIPACNGVKGRASFGGRHGDIFLPIAGAGRTDWSWAVAGTATHELLHLYGIGHAGEIRQPGPEEEGLRRLGEAAYGKRFDLVEYLRAATYFEYGKVGDVMSSAAKHGRNKIHLSTLQENIYGKDATRSRSIGTDPTSVSAKEALQGGMFGLLPLSTPIEVRNEGADGFTAFDAMAVVPLAYPVSGKPRLWAAEMYLIHTDSNVVASIGYLVPGDDVSKEWTLTFNDQTLDIVLDERELLLQHRVKD